MRSFVAALTSALLVATGLTLIPTPPPAQAALTNVFPADSFGFPKDRFFVNEALFATFISDLGGGITAVGGGRICVVAADSFNPAAMNCDSDGVWGGTNYFIGIGTFLGMPLAPPGLPPGEWLLLADEGTPDASQPDGVRWTGTELSQPFRVVSCQGPCPVFDGEQVFQQWKTQGCRQATGYKALGSAADARAFQSAAEAGRGMYALAGGGLAAMLLGGAWGALNYFVDTSNEARALSALKSFSFAVSNMYQSICDDPPRFDYDVPTEAEFLEYPSTGDPLWDQYTALHLEIEAYGLASRIANERFQGAEIDGNVEAAAMQAQATADHTFSLVRALRQLEILQPLITDREITQGPLTTQEDFDRAIAARADIAENGHSEEQRDTLLNAIGVTEQTILDLEAEYAQPDFAATDISVSLAERADQIGTELPATIEAYEKFGIMMAIRADEIRRTIPGPPVNSAPISSFTATPTTGEAPLTVEFTSTAIDPDGDELSLRWDIAGVRTVDNETTITHTFDSPGNYGVSLVADDGEEWHQAVLWISVYPPGADGSDNQPPIARFTPTLVDQVGPVTQTFTSQSFDPDGDELTHTWYFGDGEILTGESVTRTFDPGFIYSVLLVVSDGSLTGQAAGEVTSRNPGGDVPPNAPPTAAFTATPASGIAPLDVDFVSTSTDPDGDELTHTWYFGDGTTAEGAEVSHTYLFPGTFDVTLVVSDGQVSRVATERIEALREPRVLEADFSVSRGYDAAKLVNGARIFSVSSEQNTTTAAASNVVAPTTASWSTATGQTTDQQITLHLAGDGRDLLDRLVLTGLNSTASPRTFTLELSNDDTPLGTYDTVIDRAEMVQGTAAQEFAFATQTARFARLTLHDNRGASTIQLREIALPTIDRAGGVVSLTAGIPARVLDFSTATQSGSAANMLTSTTAAWQTATGSVADQFVRIELAGDTPQDIAQVALRGGGTTQSPREFEVRVSADGVTWTTVLADEIPANTELHTFDVDVLGARFAELRVLSNHGASFIAVREFQLLTAQGMNAANGAGGGATIIDFSSRQGTSTPLAPENALDPTAAGGWRTAAGANTDQFITLLLRNGQIETIDRIMLSSTLNNARPRTVEVWTSASGSDTADFSKVADRTLLNVNGEQWLTFDPVEARFVQVRFVDSYSTNYIQIDELQVFATSRGAAEAPFVDLSAPGEVPIVSWAWDFGFPGGSSTEQHPRVTFPEPGSYSVTLTVTDADGQQRVATGAYTVPELPQVSLSGADTVLDEGELVGFTAEVTSGTSVIEWEWDLDYTQSATTGPVASARFPDQGEYVVSVRGLSADGLWTPAVTRAVEVRNVPPSVGLGGLTMYAAEPFTLPNSANVNDVAADLPLLCTVDFGDGTSTVLESCTSTTLRQVAHTYEEAGVYDVVITADDRDGGVATSTPASYTALPRPVLLQVTSTTRTDEGLDVAVVAVDALSGAPLAEELTLAGGGSAVTADTDAAGELTVTLPIDTELLNLVFGGSPVHAAASLQRPVTLPAADIVFVVDQSTSMGAYIARIRERIGEITAGLGASLDYRLGLVGLRGGPAFGGSPVDHAPIESTLTDGLGSFVGGVGALSSGFGGSINNFTGVVAATDEAMGFRENSAVCVVLVSDADVGEIGPSTPDTTQQEAIEALQSRGASLFSLIASNSQLTLDAYGPGPGLTGQVGGEWWPINSVANDASAVLDSLVSECVLLAETPDVALAKMSDSDIVEPGAEVDYTLTVRNEGAVGVTGVSITDSLPAGVAVTSVSDGGQIAEGAVTWPEFSLAPGETAERRLTLRMPSTGLPFGDTTVVNRAAVVLGAENADERDVENNSDEHPVVVRVTQGSLPEDPVDPDRYDLSITTIMDDTEPLAAGDIVEYRIRVANEGNTAASNIEVRELISPRFRVLSVEAPGWDNAAGSAIVSAPSGGASGGQLSLTRESLEEGESSTIVVTAELLPVEQPAVITDVGTLTTDVLPAVVAAPDDELTWDVCVSAARDDDATNDCASTTVELADLVIQATVRLVGGAPFLIVSADTSGSLGGEPLSLTWLPLRDGEPVHAEPASVELTGLDRGVNHIVPWPGVVVDDGQVVGLPGWRPVAEPSFVLDTDDPSYPWRYQSEVRVVAGVEAAVIVEYREVAPNGQPEVPVLPQPPGGSEDSPDDGPNGSAVDPTDDAETVNLDAGDAATLPRTGGGIDPTLWLGALALILIGVRAVIRRPQAGVRMRS